MSTSHRICETCVYCSFAGNCDRHDKPLTSIEQPACDAYEIHPLLAENAKLREQIHWLKQGDILHVLTDQEYIDQCERERLMQVSIDALDKENAKLRELVKSMYYDLTNMTFPPDWVTDYEADMRELGVDA